MKFILGKKETLCTFTAIIVELVELIVNKRMKTVLEEKKKRNTFDSFTCPSVFEIGVGGVDGELYCF